MKKEAKIPMEFNAKSITKFNDDGVYAGDKVTIINIYSNNKYADVKLNGKDIKRVSMENIMEAFYLMYKDYE